MTKLQERHDITDYLYIYKQDNSKRWYARFSLHGKWYSKATKQIDKGLAAAVANQVYAEFKLKLEHNIPLTTKRFKDVAELSIKRMEQELDDGNGKAIYNDYIGVLRKYHIPFFDKLHITSIDQAKLVEFDKWRVSELGRQPAKSTIMNHNSAFQRVFDEAVLNKWMLELQVPKLKNNGTQGERRAAFTEEEFRTLVFRFGDWYQESRKDITRQIRELLYDYMFVAIYTGIRPGTELDQITWADVKQKKHNGNKHTLITIRKGKTTKYTGTRTVVCQIGAELALNRLKERFKGARKNDLVFRLADGSTTKELGKAFEQLLQFAELKEDANGKRTLYSLRHSYITWQLQRGTNIHVLAEQCGNSADIIERHYRHLVPEMHIEELSGINDDLKIEKLSSDISGSNVVLDGTNFKVTD